MRVLRSVGEELGGTQLAAVAAVTHPEEPRARVPGVPRDLAVRFERTAGRDQPRGPAGHAASRRRPIGPEAFTSPPIFEDEDGLPTTDLTLRVESNGEEHGWIVARMSLEELWRFVDGYRVGSGRLRAGALRQSTARRARQSRQETPVALPAEATATTAGSANRSPRPHRTRRRISKTDCDTDGRRGCSPAPASGSPLDGRSSNSRPPKPSRSPPRSQRQLLVAIGAGAARHGRPRLALGPLLHHAHLRADARDPGARRRPHGRARRRSPGATRSASSATRSTRWPTASSSCRRTSGSRSGRRCSGASPPASSTTSRIRSRTSATAAS